jgi:hypothetical protein
MLTRRRFTSEEFREAVAPLSHDVVGTSVEGRPLLCFQCGHGPISVITWSQIHGDEPTGTMILADLLHELADPANELSRQIHDKVTLYILPMLNPDGTHRFVRVNAQGLDPNRDARVWVTPEATTLRQIVERVSPQFAIDLHDQDPRKRVGKSSKFVAYSVLAPKASEDDEESDTRTISKQLASIAAETLNRFCPGHVARYPDTFEPRGLEEYMQARGTSVVLLETAGWPGDYEKQYLRRAGLAAVIDVLRALADGSYRSRDAATYDGLPENGGPVHDLLLRGGMIADDVVGDFRADIAIDFDAPLERCGGKISEIGDLADEHAFDVVDARGLFIRRSDREPVRKDTSADLEVARSRNGIDDLVYLIEDGRLLRHAEDESVAAD